MIRGKVRECAPVRIEHTMNANIHNRFDIEVRDAKTNELKQKAQAFNVICDNFWKYIGGWFKYIAYGDGTGVPSATDTALFGTQTRAESTSLANNIDIKNGVCYETYKVVLSETTSVGMTITEVGLMNSDGYLITHAMIQDMNGNPISIIKTNTDILTIYATVYVHWNPSEQNGITITSSSTVGGSFVQYAIGHSASNIRTEAGSGTFASRAATGYASKTWNSKTKTLTVTSARAGVDDLNISGGFGFLSVGWGPGSGYVSAIVDVRGEYEVTGESVGTGDGSTTTFATKFDMPRNAVVYVNGVTMRSGVTVYPHPVNSNAATYLLTMLDTLHNGKPCFTTYDYIETSKPTYVYNPLNELGIGSIPHFSYSNFITFAFSDDFIHWSNDYSAVSSIPDEYRHSKYIRIRSTRSSSISTNDVSLTFPDTVHNKNIVFDTPPPAGSVITIDYITPFVPKDENHVYDFSMTVQYGEYTEG